MSVIRTDQWLLDSYHNPIDICEMLRSYFSKASAAKIYEYLKMHGMYRPLRQGREQVDALQKNKVWEIVQKDYLTLQKSWGGPDIPIFIFPTDVTNRKIQRDFNGKSGVAFKDKLFLFFTEQNTEKEMSAVLTHEYNHVCRLAKFRKSEDQYVLLDTIILEGLAENAVRERLGTGYLANWTSYYTDEELEKMWTVLLRPNKNIKKTDRKHLELLYGLRRTYPNMLGYCVGYYLVKKYMEENKLSSKELFPQPTHIIAGIE